MYIFFILIFYFFFKNIKRFDILTDVDFEFGMYFQIILFDFCSFNISRLKFYTYFFYQSFLAALITSFFLFIFIFLVKTFFPFTKKKTVVDRIKLEKFFSDNKQVFEKLKNKYVLKLFIKKKNLKKKNFFLNYLYKFELFKFFSPQYKKILYKKKKRISKKNIFFFKIVNFKNHKKPSLFLIKELKKELGNKETNFILKKIKKKKLKLISSSDFLNKKYLIFWYKIYNLYYIDLYALIFSIITYTIVYINISIYY